jgi:hypothetical protein
MTARAPRCAVAALVLLASGCILPALGTHRSGRPVGDGDASWIVGRRTTKAELFDRLGPPMAIAARGEYVEVPAATVHHLDEMSHRVIWFGGDSWSQQGDAWLELFAARRPLRDSHRVYYWYATSESGVSFFLLVGVATRHASLEELWVLVDEETGIAEDAVYRAR